MYITAIGRKLHIYSKTCPIKQFALFDDNETTLSADVIVDSTRCHKVSRLDSIMICRQGVPATALSERELEAMIEWAATLKGCLFWPSMQEQNMRALWLGNHKPVLQCLVASYLLYTVQFMVVFMRRLCWMETQTKSQVHPTHRNVYTEWHGACCQDQHGEGIVLLVSLYRHYCRHCGCNKILIVPLSLSDVSNVFRALS